MAPSFLIRLGRRRTRSQAVAQLRIPFRNVREVAGTTVLQPDWPLAQARRADVAVVLHLDAPGLLGDYLASIDRASAPVDFFVVLPDTTGAAPALDEATDGIRELLLADTVSDGLFQLTSLINSGRLVGYRTVVRHVAHSAADHAVFAKLDLDSVDALVHSDLDRGGVVVSGGKPQPIGRDVTYRVSQLLKRVNTRFRESDLKSTKVSLSTVALRGAVLEFLRPLRIDHQDFHIDYAQLIHEGQATEYLKPAKPDRFAARSLELTLLYLVDAAGLRIEPLAKVEAGEPSAPGTLRASAWAIYHPELATPSRTRDATWSRLNSSQPMFLGQQLPLAPAALGFANPELTADRARQRELALSVGVTGFLVLSSWTEDGFDAEPFFASLEPGEDFPWAVVVQQSPAARINPVGTAATVSPWTDLGPESYPAQAARIAELAAAPGYLRMDGRPVVVVHDLTAIVDPLAFTGAIRSAVLATSGIDPWIAGVQSELTELRPAGTDGLDAAIQLPPEITDLRQRLRIGGRFAGFTGPVLNLAVRSPGTTVPAHARADENLIPGAFVGFDTTPELRSQGTVGYNWNIGSFRRMLEAAVRSVAWREERNRIVVINSWNGWADTSQLEPGYHRGDSYLSVVKDTLFL